MSASPIVRIRSDGILPQCWSLTIPAHLANLLFAHLFPGDHDEHGTVILAGVTHGPKGLRLLAREVVLARDGIDFVASTRGYRMLTGEFVTRQIRRSRDEGLIYLAVHNHHGTDRVGFSDDDLASHRRGYPALLDITRGVPVGALVLATDAIAGELWISASEQIVLTSARILGPSIRHMYPTPPAPPVGRAAEYDRQARLLGDRGQDILSRIKVGVIGAGGVGSLIVEYLARLGVGAFVIADPERVELTNVPRITGTSLLDAMAILTADGRPAWLRHLGYRLSRRKVAVMERLIRRANPCARVEVIPDDFVYDRVARRFTACDYLFLAADSMQARLVFNAIVHAYLIPGVQVGSKVLVDETSGEISDVFTVSRPVMPSHGCLLCNGFITAKGLQQEAETARERRAQRYVPDVGVVAPSVITLNATAASHSVNDFLFAVTGLSRADARTQYLKISPRRRRVNFEEPRMDSDCPHCGISTASGFAMGDAAAIYTSE